MRLSFVFTLLFLAGCTAPTTTAVPPTDSALPTSTSLPVPTSASPGAWQTLVAEVESLETEDGLYALRHDPASVNYDISFEPVANDGRTVSTWLFEDGEAFAAVNCGFYRDDGDTLAHIGLLMANGEGWADLRSNWGGVLIVRDGAAFIARRPERLLAPATLGIQGWPTLVQNGAPVPQLNAEELARRTAVGIDKEGRVVWVVATEGLTLSAFAERLLEPDLALVTAVNLDGGISSGLRWRNEGEGKQSGPDSLPIPCTIRFSSPG